MLCRRSKYALIFVSWVHSLTDRQTDSPINDICVVIVYVRDVYIGSILGLCYSCITVCGWGLLLGVLIGGVFADRWRGVLAVCLREQDLLVGGFGWLAAFVPSATVMVSLIRLHIDLVCASCAHTCRFTAWLLGLLCLDNVGCRDNHLIIVDYVILG